jgi:dihydroceramidase
LLSLLYPIIDNSLMASVIVKTSLISYGLVSTFAYLGLKTPLLFQISYGFLVAIMLYLDICIVKYKPCDVRVFYTAAIFYYTGFVLWNIDNLFCDYLQELRKLIPFIFGPFTQFHALWHCLAGYGSYLHIVFCAHSRALTRNQNVVLIKSWTGVRLKNNDHFKKTV